MTPEDMRTAYHMGNPPDVLPGQPRPRCPVCYGVSCPRCHRADAVKIIWDIPKGSWHGLCQRCQRGFRADD